MDFDDLVKELAPPPNRVGKCTGDRPAPRCATAGIELSLVGRNGEIQDIRS
jgi:hypothetical protein